MNDYQYQINRLIQWREEMNNMYRLDVQELRRILHEYDMDLKDKTQIPSPEEVKEYLRNKNS